jgi:hypothetical protein
VAAQTKERPHQKLTAAQMHKTRVQTRHSKAKLPSRTAKRLTVNTVDYVVWDKVYCDNVAWNETCSGTLPFDAPSGWQMCKPFWGKVEAGRGGPTWRVTKVNSIRATYYMSVSGSGKWYDRWGSNLDVYNVGARLIEAPSTAAERKEAGCVDDGWVGQG